MSDLADLQSSIDHPFFRIACNDVLRIVSILSLDSTDVTKPIEKKSFFVHFQEKSIFFGRFLYMVFIKGFTPTVFDILPYYLWVTLTALIYVYRLIVLPFWLRLTGYGKYANWKGLGTKQPDKTSKDANIVQGLSLSKKDRLSKISFGDDKYEYFLYTLFKLSTHLSPHSQSPGNPFTHSGFPGNFFNHLTGVYKILLAWQQPCFVRRAGLFHSVYGTFDYRYSMYDLRDGRDALTSLIGEGAEEIAFALCTSDRIGLIQDLYKTMYGPKGSKSVLSANNNSGNNEDVDQPIDGNPYPKLISELTELGYPVRNHITQQIHVLPAPFFAQFILVTIADFMEQGAIGYGSADIDICLFQFMRFRFYNDLIMFVKPFLYQVPPVWLKYMGKQNFLEPTRHEINIFTKHWKNMLKQFLTFSSSKGKNEENQNQYFQYSNIHEREFKLILNMIEKYPYLSEPRIFIASTLAKNEQSQVKFHLFFFFILLNLIGIGSYQRVFGKRRTDAY